MKKFLLLSFTFYYSSFPSFSDPIDKPARGFEDEIFVVADSVEYEELRTAYGNCI